MESLTARVLRSSILLMLMRLLQRSIGLISMLILARVLVPEDFGLIAIVALIVHFCDGMANTGTQHYIAQKGHVSEDDLNTAWTLDIIIRVVLWIAVILLAPMLSVFFERTELENALIVASFMLPIAAANNPKFLMLRRELNYNPIFKVTVAQRLFSFAATMGYLWIDQSFWALVVGDLTSALVMALGSYYVTPHKPRLGLKSVVEQWRFTRWTLLRAIVGYIRGQFDVFLTTRFYLPADIGAYHVTRSISVMPVSEVIGPATEPLIAAFAKAKDDPDTLAHRISLSALVIVGLAFPAAAFMWTFPQVLVDFFLGEQWTGADLILQALTPLIVAFIVSSAAGQCLVALGKVRELFIFGMTSTVLAFSTLLYFRQDTVAEFAALRSAIGIFTAVIACLYVSQFVRINGGRMVLMALPLAALSALAAYITHFVLGGVHINVVVDLASRLSLFGILMLGGLSSLYFIVYRHSREGQAIADIAISRAEPLLQKVRARSRR